MSELKRPMFSIICATYNRADLLPRAIDSVLAQSYREWELIIIDDGSSDGTSLTVQPYLRDPRVNYIKNESNNGVGYCRNVGIRNSQAQWVVLLDSDNALLPSALECASFRIEKSPQIKMHKFCVRSFEGADMGGAVKESTIIDHVSFLKDKFAGEYHSLTQRSCLVKHPFFESVNGGEGIIWKLIAMDIGAVAYHPEFTQLYDSGGEDRLSVRSKNTRRLKKVYYLDLKYLGRHYAKHSPRKLAITLLKYIAYSSIRLVKEKWK